MLLGAATLSLFLAGSCARTYASTNEIQLVAGAWEIGTASSDGIWNPLACRPALNPGFLGDVDGNTLDLDGEGHVGQAAAFAIYPNKQVPSGTRFTVNAMGLFGSDQLRFDLPDSGWAFLDRRRYQPARSTVAGVPLEIDAEPTNPEIEIAQDTFGRLVSLFPFRAGQIADSGQARVILAMNRTEGFQAKPIVPNGFHHVGSPYYAVLYSEDGTGTQEHRVKCDTLHSEGQRVRIPGWGFATIHAGKRVRRRGLRSRSWRAARGRCNPSGTRR